MARAKAGSLIFGLVALVGSFLIVRGLAEQPGGFTDVFYHFNAASRLAGGHGLTDPYLWVYMGMPEALPAASHLYWMPLTSLLAALGMSLLDDPLSYAAAQWPFVLLLAGMSGVGFWLGQRLGGTRRHAWLVGMITLSGGYYMRFWGATDTFTPYGLFGSLCLVFLGLYVLEKSPRYAYLYAGLSGALAGLGHLTRADGLLLLVVGWAVVLWPVLLAQTQGTFDTLKEKVTPLIILTLAYGLVMLPWFARNMVVVGAPLPLGGAQGIWFTEYNDLFNYPPVSNPQTFFSGGIALLLSTRWEAFVNNLGTFVAVEGMIVLTPLMLVGLWVRRREGFVRGFWLYALGLHLVMTLVFPFPGYRGGLFHSAAALLPWWAALGVAGLDDVVDWVAKRRRTWRASSAKWIFSLALLSFIVFLSLSLALPRRIEAHTPALYSLLQGALPEDARVMVNDPAQLYYFTGYGGVVLPNETPDVLPEIAGKYGVDYLLLEYTTVNGQTSVAASAKLASILDTPPGFLTRVDLDLPGAVLYAFDE